MSDDKMTCEGIVKGGLRQIVWDATVVNNESAAITDPPWDTTYAAAYAATYPAAPARIARPHMNVSSGIVAAAAATYVVVWIIAGLAIGLLLAWGFSG